ncbi:LysR family transcriptional regulator [Bradyrhizobium sp. NBAIM01]|uniref:LysR family transcriptional regulator n=1 Tax=Bradyrhizobium sp. NBAIM01 TaxID=2793818 RepID=UPI001CD494C7|nr:LysR family transcriptional regulator [Bradyrhizobium sp. NBAIM01]
MSNWLVMARLHCLSQRALGALSSSAKFVILSDIISFLHEVAMDSDALNTFLAVHRRGGISHAAKFLHRSQPAISRRIALLEQELGVPLFERVAGRTRLSDAGRVLIPYAERAVAAAQDAEQAIRALTKQNAGPVSLAVTGTLADSRLSTIMKRFTKEHPAVVLSLRTATSAEVSDLIRRGEATIGLRYNADRSGDLACEQILRESLQVVCAPDHPRAGQRVKRLAELGGERWIAFPEIRGRREIAAAHVFALFLTRGLGEVEWTAVDSLTAQKRLVESGFGLALLAKSHVAEELRAGSIATIAVGDLGAHQDIILVTRRDGFLSAAAERLLETIRRNYAGPNVSTTREGRRRTPARKAIARRRVG